MKLSPADLEKLQSKELANVLRKLHGGKTLTAAERALIAQSTEEPAVQTSGNKPVPGYARNWNELAELLDVSRRALSGWRADPRYAVDCPAPRPDGRLEVAAFARWCLKHNLKRGGLNLEALPPEIRDGDGDGITHPPALGGTQSDWTKAKLAKQVEAQDLELQKARGKLLVAAELEIPLGALFVAIQNKLTQYPERTAPQVAGFTDVQEITAILRGEMEADLGDLHAARYLDELQVIVATMPDDEHSQRLFKLVSFDGQDRAILDQYVMHAAGRVLRAIGRRVLADATGQTRDVLHEKTGQVTDHAEETSATLRGSSIAPASADAAAAPARKVKPRGKANASKNSATKGTRADAKKSRPQKPKRRRR